MASLPVQVSKNCHAWYNRFNLIPAKSKERNPMKIKTILLTSFLVLCLVLSGCGSKKPTETTVNLPAVSGQTENTPVSPAAPNEPPVATEVQEAPVNSYPIEHANEVAGLEAELMYPVDITSPTYDAEMRAYIEQILNGTAAIEDLLGKEDEQVREILLNAAQGRINLSDGILGNVMDWLKKQ